MKNYLKKFYRNKNITTEEQLREEILKDAQVSFAKESDRMFMKSCGGKCSSIRTR